MEIKLVFDMDFAIYAAACSAQQTKVCATHIPTGEPFTFSNRTELWGNWRTKDGGWIKEQNEEYGKAYKAEDFVVEDLQIDLGIHIATKKLDKDVRKICENLGAKSYYGYTGRGETFRNNAATVMEYKGNRKDLIRPIHLDAMKEYAMAIHNCHLVEGVEADDMVAIDCLEGYRAWKKNGKVKVIAIAVDKDAKQTEGWHFNPDKDYHPSEEGGVKAIPRLVEGLGELYLNAKGDVDGEGALWLYHQILCGDSVDNYKANSGNPSVKWGEKASYKLLKDCKKHKEAIKALATGYKTIYPEPMEIVGWRGDKIKIDWKYMLQENWTLAMMLRRKGDCVHVPTMLDKLGIE
jgi:5'-3' exonuclease